MWHQWLMSAGGVICGVVAAKMANGVMAGGSMAAMA